MNQQNFFVNTIASCKYFYGKTSGGDPDEIPSWGAPAAGFLPGLILAIFSGTFVLFTGPVAGGLVAAIVVPLVLEILTGWQGISVTVACLERLISRNKTGTQTGVASDGLNMKDLMQRQILFASIYVFRMVVFGVLAASGNSIWFVYVLGGAYLIRGELLREDDFTENFRYGNWFFLVIFSLIAGFLSFHWSAILSLPLALVLTALLLLGCRRLIDKVFGYTEKWIVDLLGYFSENIMLIVGLILFGRMIHG